MVGPYELLNLLTSIHTMAAGTFFLPDGGRTRHMLSKSALAKSHLGQKCSRPLCFYSDLMSQVTLWSQNREP
jgi:hypothetical protein